MICRLGHPGLIKWLHKKRGNSWPCFQLRIEILYSPFWSMDSENTIVENATSGSMKIQHHRHVGLTILTKGETGRVRRFTWTSFFLGLSSILDVWLIRLFIMRKILSLGCFGPVGKLYRNALCQRVAGKDMISAWFSRSVTAMSIFKAGKVVDQSAGCWEDHDHVVEKIRDRLEKAGAKETAEYPDLRDWVKDQLKCLGMDFDDRLTDEAEEQWLKANDAKGDITIADIKVLYEGNVHLNDVGNKEEHTLQLPLLCTNSERSNTGRTSEHGEDRATYQCLPSHRSLVCEEVPVNDPEQGSESSSSSSETGQHCT